MPEPARSGGKKSGARSLADLVRPALDPVLAKQGLSQTSLILDWTDIVGGRIAALCEPARLQWPPRGPKTDPSRLGPAMLWLRVAPGRGLEVSHHAPIIVERVNAHFGWRCVDKVAVRPEPKRLKPKQPVPPPERPEARAQAARMTQRVEDAALRDALTRLGAAVLSRR